MFKNLNEALDWLYEQKKLKRREDLSRIGYLVKKLNIKFNYKIVHIAGTNGKGSTASFIKKMLELSDKKVGLFVSPFVIKFIFWGLGEIFNLIIDCIVGLFKKIKQKCEKGVK